SMELLCGETLAERLKKKGRFTPAAALPLIEHMASALSAAHRAGIVHRDFKPANVVLVAAREGNVRAVVTDFGLASQSVISDSDSVSTAESLSRHFAGTPPYMSPEQIEGSSPTAASDIYSLGLVIYEMVTGQRPFHGDTPMSEALKRITESPIAPR